MTNVDPDEVARFSAIAAEWWDPGGKFAPLHKFNPVRLGYIRDWTTRHFDRPERRESERLERPFEGLRFLDVGCGGGLLSEPMARLGAAVTGLDASEKNIRTAAVHASEHGLSIDYRTGTVEECVAAGERFNVVLTMEVVEHVPDPAAFLSACASAVAPGGLLFVATLNRTFKAFALAILGAEYVLGWLPRGTHDWNKFVTPEEAEAPLAETGLSLLDRCGVSFNPLTDRWSLSDDTDVNYMLLAARPRN